MFRILAALLISTATLVAPHSAFAQSTSFKLELNNAQQANGSCLLTYVATNNTGVALQTTAYEVAVFDQNSVVSRLLILEFGALPVGKTKVVQFNLGDKACDQISRLLINGVAECTIDTGPYDKCLEHLETASRTEIEFGL